MIKTLVMFVGEMNYTDLVRNSVLFCKDLLHSIQIQNPGHEFKKNKNIKNTLMFFASYLLQKFTHWLGYVIFALFVFLVIIVLLNVLNGLAVRDIGKIQVITISNFLRLEAPF